MPMMVLSRSASSRSGSKDRLTVCPFFPLVLVGGRAATRRADGTSDRPSTLRKIQSSRQVDVQHTLQPRHENPIYEANRHPTRDRPLRDMQPTRTKTRKLD